MLDSSPASSLTLSYLVEVVTERDAELLNQLQQLVEAKRRELRHRAKSDSQRAKKREEDKA